MSLYRFPIISFFSIIFIGIIVGSLDKLNGLKLKENYKPSPNRPTDRPADHLTIRYPYLQSSKGARGLACCYIRKFNSFLVRLLEAWAMCPGMRLHGFGKLDLKLVICRMAIFRLGNLDCRLSDRLSLQGFLVFTDLLTMAVTICYRFNQLYLGEVTFWNGTGN